jgi:hypothetical protein
MENNGIDKLVEKQVQKYFRKVAPKAGSRLSSPEARERVRAAFAHQAELSRRTRDVLGQCTDPVGVMEHPKYMCFTREVDRLVRFYKGPHVPERDLKVLLFKYNSWDLSEPILRRLMAELFDIHGEDGRRSQAGTSAVSGA